MFGQLCRAEIGRDPPGPLVDERGIETPHHLEGLLRLGSHQDPIGSEGVVDRASLPQELGVRDHEELCRPAITIERPSHPLRGARGDGALLGHHHATIGDLGDRPRRLLYGQEIGFTG